MIPEDALKRETVTHSSILTWEIPWTEEPGRLQSVGSQRVRHNLETEQQQQQTQKTKQCAYMHTHTHTHTHFCAAPADTHTLLHSSKCLMKMFNFQIRTNCRDKFLRIDAEEDYSQI